MICIFMVFRALCGLSFSAGMNSCAKGCENVRVMEAESGALLESAPLLRHAPPLLAQEIAEWLYIVN